MQISDSFIDTIANQGHNKEELTPYLMLKMLLKQKLLEDIMKED
jgi:hypothetical protein